MLLLLLKFSLCKVFELIFTISYTGSYKQCYCYSSPVYSLYLNYHGCWLPVKERAMLNELSGGGIHRHVLRSGFAQSRCRAELYGQVDGGRWLGGGIFYGWLIVCILNTINYWILGLVCCLLKLLLNKMLGFYLKKSIVCIVSCTCVQSTIAQGGYSFINPVWDPWRKYCSVWH